MDQKIKFDYTTIVTWKGPALTEVQEAAFCKAIEYRMRRIVSEELSNYAGSAEDITVDADQ